MKHLLLLGLFFGLAQAGFIPGDGCGSTTEIVTIDKLPEDPEDLAALKCVQTSDEEGLQRLTDSKAGIRGIKHISSQRVSFRTNLIPKKKAMH